MAPLVSPIQMPGAAKPNRKASDQPPAKLIPQNAPSDASIGISVSLKPRNTPAPTIPRLLNGWAMATSSRNADDCTIVLAVADVPRTVRATPPLDVSNTNVTIAPAVIETASAARAASAIKR